MFVVYVIVFIFLLSSLVYASEVVINSILYFSDRYNLNKIWISALLLSVGTSLPEISFIFPSVNFLEDGSFLIFGTILGSNIFNTSLALSIPLLSIFPFRNIELNKVNIILFILCSSYIIFLLVVIFLNNTIFSSVVLLFFFVIFFFYSIYSVKEKKNLENNSLVESTFIKEIVFLIIGIFWILSTSYLLTIITERIQILFNIPKSFSSLILISMVTSLPELIMVYKSVKKKEGAIAIGSILGSNISNIFLIGGFSFFFLSFPIGNFIFLFSTIIMMILLLVLIFFKIFVDSLGRLYSVIILGIYLFYFLFIICSII